MKIFNRDEYVNGWFIGDFEPSIIKTKDFEIAYRENKKGEIAEAHYHKEAEEINYFIFGKISVNGEVLTAPVIYMVEKNEITRTEFLEDSGVIIVKVPSVIGDKFVI